MQAEHQILDQLRKIVPPFAVSSRWNIFYLLLSFKWVFSETYIFLTTPFYQNNNGSEVIGQSFIKMRWDISKVVYLFFLFHLRTREDEDESIFLAFRTVAPLKSTDNKSLLLSQHRFQLTASSYFLTFSVRSFTSLKEKKKKDSVTSSFKECKCTLYTNIAH